MQEGTAERIVLDAQIRGERSIARARLFLMAILALIATYIFLSAVAERSLALEIRRPVYYAEAACILLCVGVSLLVLRITGRGVYGAWMRYVPSFIDITCVATVHVAMGTEVNPSYSFTGATVWLYLLFIAVSALRNSGSSTLFTGAYAALSFIAINTAFFAAMGNFAPGGNVYPNLSGSVVKLDFEDEAIKALVMLAVTAILAVVGKRDTLLLRKAIELQVTTERYAETLRKVNVSLERFIPREFLGFLGKENILEVELGDWKECSMTIFFLDIRDFTALSEGMSPRDNFRFLNSFLGLFGPIVRTHGGFVDKYPGDGIMALFPAETDEALEAALEMRDKLRDYNVGRIRSEYTPIRFGIGIHSGPIMLGTIGENNRMDSTVISDAVNTASRLEGLTKKFSVEILVSGDTLDALSRKGAYEARFVGKETVKGKARAVDVYELIGKKLDPLA